MSVCNSCRFPINLAWLLPCVEASNGLQEELLPTVHVKETLEVPHVWFRRVKIWWCKHFHRNNHQEEAVFSSQVGESGRHLDESVVLYKKFISSHNGSLQYVQHITLLPFPPHPSAAFRSLHFLPSFPPLRPPIGFSLLSPPFAEALTRPLMWRQST